MPTDDNRPDNPPDGGLPPSETPEVVEPVQAPRAVSIWGRRSHAPVPAFGGNEEVEPPRRDRAFSCSSIGLFVVILALCIGPFLSGRVQKPWKIIDKVPIGSGVNELHIITDAGTTDYSTVTSWIKTDDLSKAMYDKLRSQGVIRGTKYGDFRQKELGAYSNQCPPQDERDHFTGEITFHIDRFFDDTLELSFVFVDGKLVHKGGGYLPG